MIQSISTPTNIYMSALLPKRDDLLIEILDIHFIRIFERINKLVGDYPDGTYYVRDHVVQD